MTKSILFGEYDEDCNCHHRIKRNVSSLEIVIGASIRFFSGDEHDSLRDPILDIGTSVLVSENFVPGRLKKAGNAEINNLNRSGLFPGLNNEYFTAQLITGTNALIVRRFI